LGIVEEYSFIMTTVILLGLCLLVEAFFFLCIGKATHSVEGSKDRIRAALAYEEGKYEDKAFASACVGFFTLDIMLSAYRHIHVPSLYKKTIFLPFEWQLQGLV
jgi:hypothetical protein